jgi:isoleucyl-tRNA synthetase
MFKKDKESFAKREERVLAFWTKEDIFHKSLKNRVDAEHFSFYDGPPFATGLPHYGHILAGTIKDVVARYKTMKGFSVPRRFGWDCHGLPVENEIEKSHNLSGALQIEAYGIDKFNEECRKIVLRYTAEWKKTVLRMGRWVEFDKTYHTMDISFMESVWWVFSEIWKKGLVYEGFKVMHYSPKLGTPISNFEANLNYREVDDPSLTLKFELVGEKAYVLVWTTTPWTLPSNLGLAVGPKLEYVKIRENGSSDIYILAKNRLSVYFPEGNYEVVESFLGEKLIGKSYHPLMPYFKDHKNAFVILKGDFVATDEGTGIVHTAPAFGEDDFYVCKEAGIEIVCPIDVNCMFTSDIPEYQGVFVKDADKEIIRKLKAEGKVFKHQTIRHRYPFCWRTDLPLIYRAVSTWFIAVEKIKDKIMANNELIHWVPDHIKNGRFGKWLENARDWAVSRNRYWGTPLPIWRADDGDMIVLSSVKELEEKTGQKVDDLHRHFIDHLTFKENGKEYKRVTEVFDCWFESGSMPYAQNHYPFENKEETMREFPADFIAEGLDQTRGWFYTLTVIASALFDQPAFLNVIVNGIVLAEDGHKMSKRLKNYPDPEVVIDKYGSDAIRLCLLNSPVVRAEDMNFSEGAVEGVLKQVLLPLWNSYLFLATYAEIYEWIPTADQYDRPKADIDRWILSVLQKLIEDVESAMDQYKLDQAVEPLIAFIDGLTNWYIRRSRTRFWAEENTEDRRQAFETLYTVILTVSKLAAPFMPFLTDAIYQELKRESCKESIHLTDFPKVDEYLRDVELEEEMKHTQAIVNSGHALRKEHQIKVRQPLKKAHIISSESVLLEGLKRHEHLIREELNVKELEFHQEESHFVQLKPKPNFRVLGKKVGKFMNQVKEKIDGLDQKILKKIFNKELVEIEVEGEKIVLGEEDVLVERQVLEGLVAACVGSITIALDTLITHDLKQEGIAREIINKINTLRKQEGFEVTDRIEIKIEAPKEIEEAFILFKDYISGEILAKEVLFCPVFQGKEIDINENIVKLSVSKS